MDEIRRVTLESVVSEWGKGKVWKYSRHFSPRILDESVFGYLGNVELEVHGRSFVCDIVFPDRKSAVRFENIIADTDDDQPKFKDVLCNIHYVELQMPEDMFPPLPEGKIPSQQIVIDSIADTDALNPDEDCWQVTSVVKIPEQFSTKYRLGVLRKLKEVSDDIEDTDMFDSFDIEELDFYDEEGDDMEDEEDFDDEEYGFG